jgi:hypothetical protein
MGSMILLWFLTLDVLRQTFAFLHILSSLGVVGELGVLLGHWGAIQLHGPI